MANRADGALRDAESLFDQVVSLNAEGISADVVEQVLGLVDRSIYFEVMEAVVEENPARVIDALDRAVEAGAEVEEFTHGLVELLRHVLLAKVQESAATLDVAEEDKVNYETLGAAFATEDVMRMLQVLMDLEGELKRSVSPRFRLELALVRFALMGRAVDVGELLTRIKALEEGAVTRPATGAKPTASSPCVQRLRPLGNLAQVFALSHLCPIEKLTRQSQRRRLCCLPRNRLPRVLRPCRHQRQKRPYSRRSMIPVGVASALNSCLRVGMSLSTPFVGFSLRWQSF